MLCRHYRQYSLSTAALSQASDGFQRQKKTDSSFTKYSLEQHVSYFMHYEDRSGLAGHQTLEVVVLWIYRCCALHLFDSVHVRQVGLTQRGLEELGDIESIDGPVARASLVKAGEPLVSLEWSGFKITEADELYHTVWENVEGVKQISLPVDASILEWNPRVLHDFDAIQTENWIVRVTISDGDAQSLAQEGGEGLMGEEQYRALAAEAVAPHYGA